MSLPKIRLILRPAMAKSFARPVVDHDHEEAKVDQDEPSDGKRPDPLTGAREGERTRICCAVFAEAPEALPPADPVLVPADGGFAGVAVPLPPVIVAVSSVSDELLVQTMGTLVEPIETVKSRGSRS